MQEVWQLYVGILLWSNKPCTLLHVLTKVLPVLSNGHWDFTLQIKMSTKFCGEIINSSITNIKANWNSFAGLQRPAPGFTRHPITIWLNQMLWVTNMASQLRAAQRMLSCLLKLVTEKHCSSQDSVASVLKSCLSHRATPGCCMVWTYAIWWPLRSGYDPNKMEWCRVRGRYLMECNWNEDLFMRSSSWPSLDNKVKYLQ